MKNILIVLLLVSAVEAQEKPVRATLNQKLPFVGPGLERQLLGDSPRLFLALAASNRAARFHADEKIRQGFFAHDSTCKIVNGLTRSVLPVANAPPRAHAPVE